MLASFFRPHFVRTLGPGLLFCLLQGCGDQTMPDASASSDLLAARRALTPSQLSAMKNAIRTKLMQRSISVSPHASGLRMAIRPNEDPAALVDMGEALERNLRALETAGLLQGSVGAHPWSDSYWPTSAGLLGNRYADPSFPIANWQTRFQYIQSRPISTHLASGNSEIINLLSPAEKYDLLIRDTAGSLTQSMWSEGEEFQAGLGEIPGWFGICDGWAAASFMMPRPTKPVSFRAASGQEVTLYPSDLKALASLLWARGSAPLRHLGGRCEEVYPAADGSGRPTSAACFDSNPGAWHLAIVNQVGVAKRSLIMDSSFDYQVWNQPVLSYTYQYFNPQTGRGATSLSDAAVPIESYANDRFRSFRSPHARSVVGITMTVTYLSETRPSHNLTDGPEHDAKADVTYQYDLELDAEEKVVGGEWHQQRHPDFLWVPVADGTVSSMSDSYLQGEWTISDQVPQPWTIPLRVAAQKGQPAAKLVYALMQGSSAP